MKNLKVAAIETHVADARTCCLHPASATHRQMTEEQLEACGITPTLIRYSPNSERLIVAYLVSVSSPLYNKSFWS